MNLAKKIFFTLSIALFALLAKAQDILPKPNPPRLLVDNAALFATQDAEFLEKKLKILDDSTSNQIAVVTISTLGDYPIEEYAVKLFRSWGIGDKKKNNGILLLIAKEDRKIRIEVGYGLEGAIPDMIAQQIIDDILKPAFKRGAYFTGVDEATTILAKAAVGEYKEKRKPTKDEPWGFVILVVIIAILLLGSGRGGRGGGGGMMSRRGYRTFFPMVGGDSWGGGSSRGFGGGFGGFGGGSSGGGGASGGW